MNILLTLAAVNQFRKDNCQRRRNQNKQRTKRISHYTDKTMSYLPHLVLLLLLLQGAAVKALFLERLLLGPFAPDVCPGRCMLCTSCWILGGAVLPESPIAKYNSLRRSCFPYNR